MKKTFCLFLAIIMIVFAGCSMSNKTTNDNASQESSEEMVFSEIRWPKSEIAQLIPQPKSMIGNISWEASYGFVIYIAEMSNSDFNDYVDQCFDAGFTVNYSRGEDFYYADNADGYHIYLSLDEEDVLLIRMDEPKRDNTTDGNEIEPATKEQRDTSQSGQQPLSGYYRIGDSAVINDLQITVIGYEFSVYSGALNGLNKAKTGFEYCVVRVKVKNVGNAAYYPTGAGPLSNPKSKDMLLFDSDYEYLSSWSNYTDFFYGNESIPALGEISCCFSYEVPIVVEEENTKSLQFVFKDNTIYDPETAIWRLR